MAKIKVKEFKNYLISKLLDEMVTFVVTKIVLDIVIRPEGTHFIGKVYYKESD